VHVERLVVRNFRGIKHADIRFREGLNLIVGRNGSGKSTILEAMRILLDASLGRQARELDEGDLYGDEKFVGPANVVIAARFSGFGDTAYEKQLRLRFKADGTNPSDWLLYRFRPKVDARTQLLDGDRKSSGLVQKDYESERLVGVSDDPNLLSWDSDPSGEELKEKDLATIFIAEIPALRNVVEELRRQRTSPLVELLSTVDIPDADRVAVENAYAAAQKIVEGVPALSTVAAAIRSSYGMLTSEGQIQVRLGLTRSNYAAILKDLGVFLTDDLISDMELRRNGLGFNNLLYVAMLLENFRRRVATTEGTPMLLVEEPEAHLHPQAQEALLRSLLDQPFQTIGTTHSPYVAATAGLSKIINLDRADAVKGINLVDAAGITPEELADLDRFLNADRGTILFATTVILVEGAAEQILIPAYAAVAGHNLAKLGIQVCAINGTHFAAFEKLLGPNGLNRPYVLVKDNDGQNGPDRKKMPMLDDGADVGRNANEFATHTTLEYAITRQNSLGALAETARELGMPRLAEYLDGAVAGAPATITGEVQLAVHQGAVRAGKARFAQAFARRIARDSIAPPSYIESAIIASIEQVASESRAKETPAAD